MPKPASVAFDLPFSEAIAQAAARHVTLPDDYYGRLPAEARSQAFTISGLTALEQIKAVLDSLTGALQSGQGFRAWRDAAPADLGALPKSRRELIFRAAVQTAYNVGRTTQQREVADRRPFYMWDAINDTRTRPAHRAMDGYIAPVSDAIWNTWSPPAGFNCRCTRISLTEAQARARGYGTQSRPDVQPDDGWGYEKADHQDKALDGLVRGILELLPSVIMLTWRALSAKRARRIAAKIAEGMTAAEAAEAILDDAVD